MYTTLVRYIPIECAAGYTFVALLNCPAGSKQHRLSKLLEGLSKITKVKVGPTGVEVEVKP